ncbi:MAG: hypothetical protein QOC81_3948 [Thermoanaerobaculia bacterium]|nr:hypothetical protein [Thermoanaerobaculia bacterium]
MPRLAAATRTLAVNVALRFTSLRTVSTSRQLSIQRRRFAPAPRSARRLRNLCSRFDREQELLQRWACGFFQATPLIDGDKDGHLHSSPSNDLRPFGEAGLQQFTEARFGVLHRPRSGFFFSRHVVNLSVSHRTSQFHDTARRKRPSNTPTSHVDVEDVGLVELPLP